MARVLEVFEFKSECPTLERVLDKVDDFSGRYSQDQMAFRLQEFTEGGYIQFGLVLVAFEEKRA